MRLFMLLILLAFPILEIWLIIELTAKYDWWFITYLVIVTFLGLRLIKEEKQLFAGRMMQTLAQSANPGSALFGSVKNLIAGILFVIPGIITDGIAVILLLLPSTPSASNAAFKQSAANDDVIEGEYRRED
ncbi:FxsA family protein [Candidatus Methylopumilus turicensis]|uniref:FxsA cytoplasmic membrane protein n=1 Tax=Candidatus Methylopumilus turicensis TaxID=1581680 RepID=A0A0B7IVH3_9PROT|nr:FxsA family protein [Candidatus Methylopumilus turicensis]CEN55077.1 FxsA cytoplasmic membrane protein [Candidatus Methylopumilus turicensis]